LGRRGGGGKGRGKELYGFHTTRKRVNRKKVPSVVGNNSGGGSSSKRLRRAKKKQTPKNPPAKLGGVGEGGKLQGEVELKGFFQTMHPKGAMENLSRALN